MFKKFHYSLNSLD